MASKATLDYDAVWKAIRESSLAGLYVTEAYSLATGVVEKSEHVFSETPTPKSGSYIQVNHKLMSELVSIVDEAVRLKALITDRPRGKFESPLDFAIRTRRTKWLRNEVLGSPRLRSLLDAGVRNSIEHFDEYLDHTVADSYDGKIPMPASIPLDFVVGRRNTLSQFPIDGVKPHIHFLRVYIASERVFVNAGREVNIRNVFMECRRIAKRLKLNRPGFGRDFQALISSPAIGA